jgi:hypothetical protein
MEEAETKEDIYGSAKWRHVSFERRLIASYKNLFRIFEITGCR